jgi:hypothetical protein
MVCQIGNKAICAKYVTTWRSHETGGFRNGFHTDWTLFAYRHWTLVAWVITIYTHFSCFVCFLLFFAVF